MEDEVTQDLNRLDALRLATLIQEDPTSTIARAQQYLAFLEAGSTPAAKPAEAKQTAAKPEPKPEPKKETPPPPPPEPEPELEAPASEYTIDQVRAALKEYRSIEGAPAMLEIIKTHGGADQLTSVDPSKFAAIMEAINAAG